MQMRNIVFRGVIENELSDSDKIEIFHNFDYSAEKRLVKKNFAGKMTINRPQDKSRRYLRDNRILTADCFLYKGKSQEKSKEESKRELQQLERKKTYKPPFVSNLTIL